MIKGICDQFGQVADKAKRWRLRHPDTYRAAYEKQNKKRWETIKLLPPEKREEHKRKQREKQARWRYDNPEKVRTILQKRYQTQHQERLSKWALARKRSQSYIDQMHHKLLLDNPAKRPEVRERLRQVALKQVAEPGGKLGFVSRLPADMKGSKNPFYGRKHTVDTREKMAKHAKEKYRGPGNPNWKGGCSFEPYSPEFDEALKQTIRRRDGYKCRLCGCQQNGRKLCIHHIDYDKANNREENLIALCVACNAACNGRRDYWKEHWKGEIGLCP